MIAPVNSFISKGLQRVEDDSFALSGHNLFFSISDEREKLAT
jgi:hypothetical protein